MTILLHMCCGPCSFFPLSFFKKKGLEVSGLFYNPNIHPFQEFKRRIASTLDVASAFYTNVEIEDNYGLVEFLRRVVFYENQRCSICYDIRLKKTAEIAAKTGYDSFSTTLLYSRFQNHSLIRQKGEYWGDQFGVEFFYQDFRVGWQYGVDQSIKNDIYRQPYCGCIYSEQERYDNRLKKKLNKQHKRSLK